MDIHRRHLSILGAASGLMSMSGLALATLKKKAVHHNGRRWPAAW
jgi:hypothetical protein